MNTRLRIPTAAALVLCTGLLFSVNSALAQAKAPAPAPEPAKNKTTDPTTTEAKSNSEVIMLSPFAVNAGQDNGYQANDTLAGTRLRTELKDIAASVSVVTKQFMEDTGSNSLVDLLVYTTGTEVSGIGGNLSGNAAGSNFDNEAARSNPNPTTRVRGLAQADFTRNYFATIIPLEGYNTSSVTINRGANNILFGLGSPAGIIENSTNLPQFRDHARVTVNADNYGTFREAVDLERVLIPGKLALRIDAVNSDNKYEQDFAYSKTRRYYGVIEYHPFKSTTLRVNAEDGYEHKRLPRTNPPVDGITSWFTYFKQTRPDNIFLPGTATTTRSNFERAQNLDAALGFTSGLMVPSLFYSSASNTAGTGLTAAMPLWATIPIPVQGTFLSRMMGVRQTTDARNFAFANPPTNGVMDPVVNNAFAYNTMMMDRSVFDYRKHALYGPNDYANIDFKTFNFSAEQLFLHGDAGLEFVYDQQTSDQKQRSNFVGNRGDSIGIDVNQQLTNGAPNPNFGRIVVSSLGRAAKIENENYVYRGTGFIRHDFRDNFHNWFGKLIGKQSATVFYTDSMAKVYTINALNAAAAPSYLNSGVANTLVNRQLNAVVYIGPSLLSATGPAGANATGVQSEIQWPTTLTSYQNNADSGFVWGQRTDNVYTFDRGDIAQLATGVSATRQENLSYGEVLQGNWIDGLLVSTLGWRHDQIENFAGSVSTLDPVTGARPIYHPHTVAQLASSNTSFSQGFALHAPQRWMAKLPGRLGLSLYYNASENFRLTAARVNIFNEGIPTEGGKTKEYGIGLSAFDGKLSFRLTHYDTVQENVTDSRVTTGSNLLSATASAEQIIIQNMTPAQIAATGYKGFDQLSATSPEFQRYMAVWNFRITGTNSDGTRTATFTQPVGVADVTGAQSKGYEFEMTYNPLPGWRIAANVAEQDAVRGITANNEDALFADRFPQWKNPALLATIPLASTFPSFVTLRTQAYYTAQITENQPVQELVKWSGSVVTNYDFNKNSELKGFGIGGAARWRQGIVTGYPVVTSPSDPTLLVRDTAHAWKGKDTTTFDAWASYSRTIFRDKIKWRVQLNIRNVLNDNLMTTIAVNPVAVNNTKDYTVAQQVIGAERTWQLTSSFDF